MVWLHKWGKTRDCNDGCGNQKTESEECCETEGQCRYLRECLDRQIGIECNWGCKNRNISYVRCTNDEDEKKHQIEYKTALDENQLKKITIEGYPIIFVHGFNSDNNTFKEWKQD